MLLRKTQNTKLAIPRDAVKTIRTKNSRGPPRPYYHLKPAARPWFW